MLALLRKMKPEELVATKEKSVSILDDINNYKTEAMLRLGLVYVPQFSPHLMR